MIYLKLLFFFFYLATKGTMAMVFSGTENEVVLVGFLRCYRGELGLLLQSTASANQTLSSGSGFLNQIQMVGKTTFIHIIYIYIWCRVPC